MLDDDIWNLGSGGRLGSCIDSLGRVVVGMQRIFGMMSMQANFGETRHIACLAFEQFGPS